MQMQTPQTTLPIVALLAAAVLGYLNTRYAGHLPIPVTGLWKNSILMFVLGLVFGLSYSRYWWLFAVALLSATYSEYLYWLVKWYWGSAEVVVGLLFVYAAFLAIAAFLGSISGYYVGKIAKRRSGISRAVGRRKV